MGSWNSTCSVTHQSIGCRDDVVLILKYRPREYNAFRSLPDETSNALEDLKPYCLPIFGKYNDYGGIEKIKNTETVDKLKKTFKMSMKDIVEFLERKQLNGNDHIVSLEHHSCSGIQKYLNKIKDDEIDVESVKKWLIKSGLKKIKEGEFEFPKVNLIDSKEYLHNPECPYQSSKIVFSDDSIFLQKGKTKIDLMESTGFRTGLEDFILKVYKYSGYILTVKPSYQAEVQHLMQLEFCFVLKSVYDNAIKVINEDEYAGKSWDRFILMYEEEFSKHRERSKKWKEKFGTKYPIEEPSDGRFANKVGLHFINFYKKNMSPKWIKENCKDFIQFSEFCSIQGIKLINHYGGAQCGEHLMYKKFLKACLDDYSKKIKEEFDYDEE